MKQRGQKKAVLFVLFYVFVCIASVNVICVSSQDGEGRNRGSVYSIYRYLVILWAGYPGKYGGMVYIFPAD